MAKLTEKAVVKDEKEVVTDWRLHELCAAGVGIAIAEKLAETENDLHKMIETKEAGCSDKLLLKIYS